MTVKSFILQSITDFSDLQGDTCKARFVPTDGNLGLYPENYCRVDILAGHLYVLENSGNHPDFTPFKNGSQPILEIQFGPMLDGLLSYYLALPGNFDESLSTFTMSGDFGIQNASDYDESYLSPLTMNSILSRTMNSGTFNQIQFN